MGLSRLLLPVVCYALLACSAATQKLSSVTIDQNVNPVRSLASLQGTFNSAQVAYYKSYISALLKKPELAGVVKLSITIAGGGRVTEAHVVSSSLNDPAFEKQVLAITHDLDFGPSPIASFVYPNYPIKFVPPT